MPILRKANGFFGLAAGRDLHCSYGPVSGAFNMKIIDQDQ
jgi:hypothetical protein